MVEWREVRSEAGCPEGAGGSRHSLTPVVYATCPVYTRADGHVGPGYQSVLCAQPDLIVRPRWSGVASGKGVHGYEAEDE